MNTLERQIRVNLPEEMINRLDTLSETEDISRSAYIKKAIEAYWKEEKKIVNINDNRDRGPLVWRIPDNGIVHAK